jgi:hypothetical protein
MRFRHRDASGRRAMRPWLSPPGQIYQRGVRGKLTTADLQSGVWVDVLAGAERERTSSLYLYADGVGELVELPSAR